MDPDAFTAVQMNSVVSRPSRPTARNAVSVSAPAPIAPARVTSALSCVLSVRAVRRIQKIMPVTRPTASTLSRPPAASWARLDRAPAENVSTAAKLPDTMTAPRTPSHNGAAETRCPVAPVVFRKAASKMLTTRPASSPSRNPISRLGTASAHRTPSKVRQT